MQGDRGKQIAQNKKKKKKRKKEKTNLCQSNHGTPFSKAKVSYSPLPSKKWRDEE
jgi:hypothetical protein